MALSEKTTEALRAVPLEARTELVNELVGILGVEDELVRLQCELRRLGSAIDKLARGVVPRPFSPGQPRLRGLSNEERQLDAMQLYAEHVRNGGDADPPVGYRDGMR